MNEIKIVSWNVNGWRAIIRKGDWENANQIVDADIWCLQEIKTQSVDLANDKSQAGEKYINICNYAEKKGYSGTMILVKKELISEQRVELWNNESKGWLNWINKEDESDWTLILNEGRATAVAFTEKKTLLFNVYFPNGGMSEERLRYKMDYYAAFQRQMQVLRKSWPNIIVCGDVNTAHKEIDLARPKENSKVTGFLPIERQWIDGFIGAGWIDTFRFFYPEKTKVYSWWDYKTRARERNVGWRIDYFFITEEMKNKIKDAGVVSQIYGSDHAPIELILEI